MSFTNDRRLFHSFPRSRGTESKNATLERGLRILAFMKEFGLVLAPEIVEWDVKLISGGAEELKILQRRACFTELSVLELPTHSAIFGPISLSFDVAKLRTAGATPVIYVPQGVEASGLSYIGTFCARGTYHTQQVLRQLEYLKEISDPARVAEKFKLPVEPNYALTLQNSDSAGNIVATYTVPAANVRNVIQYLGFNSIPFDHSIGVLEVFLNIFYPTDNAHTGDDLGYYRQREWRLIAPNINLKGRPITRSLSEPEIARLHEIDDQFWTRELTVERVPRQRSSLAHLYSPTPDWNFFDLVEAIFVPEWAAERVSAVVASSIAVHTIS
jgi:hypothetical protein